MGVMKSSNVSRNPSSSSRGRRSLTCAFSSQRRPAKHSTPIPKLASEETPMNGRDLFLSTAFLLAGAPAHAGQAPFAAGVPDFPVSARDRVYAAEQFSNTVSVIDPSTNKNLGVIRLGDPQPMNLSPLYKSQVLVHGLGFSPDRKTLAVVSIASNSVTFIDTATNKVKHTTYVGRSSHKAFFTQDGREVWVTVRGEKLRGRSRRPNIRGENAHHGSERARHDDLLARWN